MIAFTILLTVVTRICFQPHSQIYDVINNTYVASAFFPPLGSRSWRCQQMCLNNIMILEINLHPLLPSWFLAFAHFLKSEAKMFWSPPWWLAAVKVINPAFSMQSNEIQAKIKIRLHLKNWCVILGIDLITLTYCMFKCSFFRQLWFYLVAWCYKNRV